MTDYEIIVPGETLSLVNFRQGNMPGIALINTALKTFEHRFVFSWHLSVVLNFTDLIARGMPSRTERDQVDPFFDKMKADIKGDVRKPNGLFLARITWNATRELIWRVHDPEIADKYLNDLISDGASPRPFDFRMDHDPKWTLAEWHLMNAGK